MQLNLKYFHTRIDYTFKEDEHHARNITCPWGHPAAQYRLHQKTGRDAVHAYQNGQDPDRCEIQRNGHDRRYPQGAVGGGLYGGRALARYFLSCGHGRSCRKGLFL